MTIPTITPNAIAGQPSKRIHYWLWSVQILLAIVFAATGTMKTASPVTGLPESIQGLPLPLVRLIGVCELLGAAGMILPAYLRVKPGLTALTAAGLSTVVLLATLHHLSRAEFAEAPVTLVLGLLAAFVAWGRWKKAPIRARGESGENRLP